jgi:hypothetical protein
LHVADGKAFGVEAMRHHGGGRTEGNAIGFAMHLSRTINPLPDTLMPRRRHRGVVHQSRAWLPHRPVQGSHQKCCAPNGLKEP